MSLLITLSTFKALILCRCFLSTLNEWFSLIKQGIVTDGFSEPSQTSKKELFAKIVNGFTHLIIFAKSSIFDIWLNSECASSVKSWHEIIFYNFTFLKTLFLWIWLKVNLFSLKVDLCINFWYDIFIITGKWHIPKLLSNYCNKEGLVLLCFFKYHLLGILYVSN